MSHSNKLYDDLNVVDHVCRFCLNGDSMEHKDYIMRRFNEGGRTKKIALEVGLTQRQVQRIIRSVTGNRSGPGKSKEYQLAHLRQLVVRLMQEQGRRFDICELCRDRIPTGKFELHHTKYDGATFYDLRIVCKACNVSGSNKWLS